jgi:type I restriction enzyme S subunit
MEQFLRLRKEFFLIDDAQEYQLITVQLHARGLRERSRMQGAEIKTKKQQRVKSDDLLVAEIDAKVGGYGIVPPELDGAIVSGHYFLYEIDQSQIEPEYLGYYLKTGYPEQDLQQFVKGSVNYAAIRSQHFFQLEIPLPPLDDQRRMVEKTQAIQKRILEINILQKSIEERNGEIVHGLIASTAKECDRKAMKDIAPLIRRSVKIDLEEEYLELGLRSFGKGTFHKPAIRGSELNGKRLFRIEPGDLLFSNVFAWEGAVAVARPEDAGRFGSHRFISRKPIEGMTSADFLYYYFTTPEGIEQLGKASPGSAGRNRTLGLKMLDEIQVPVPNYEKQLWIVSIAKRLEQLRERQSLINQEIEGLFKSVLDRAFKGEL